MNRVALAGVGLLCVLAALPARAQPLRPSAGSEVMALVRADRWDEAASAAARHPDPVVAKLVTYFRLLAPGMGRTVEIAAFIATNPDWPQTATLARRRDEALAGEPDDQVVLAECAREAPQAVAALLHCAETFARQSRGVDAARMLHLAWVGGIGDPALEQRFTLEYRFEPTPADHAARFERLISTDAAAAGRLVPRLAPADRARAEARLALRRDDAAAPGLVAALSEADRANPGLFLDQVAWLRRGGQDEAAQALWITFGNRAETAAGERRAGFWAERNIMARRRLRQGDTAGAYAIAAGHAQTGGETAADAEFLAGFLALRKLADPARALVHFRKLAALSGAAITQGRALYWIGRAEEATGHTEQALTAYAAAARWPNTFYGQLGALKSGDTAPTLAARITATLDPPADPLRMMDWAGRELARAATRLAEWGEARRAQPFLLRLDEVAPDAIDKALVARLATGLGMPETAVALARRAGREGVILLETGWPQPVSPPAMAAPEPALSLAIMRQESSFDTAIVSPAGARGLMQLMPATATATARKLGIPASIPALVLDPAYNMRLGTVYLRDLLTQYADTTPLAVAAYNAGPARVAEWIGLNGDPRSATIDVLDWIELIPFGETRNYVQRVTENQVIYRAKRGETKPHPLASWLR